jgi:hypothetical protein
VAQNYGQVETLSLRAELPYHYAQLSLDNGCFLGLSLTPPDANGGPGAPRSPVLADNAIVIDEPLDGATTVENGFTLTGRATIPPNEAEGALWVQVETRQGEPLLETTFFYDSWDQEREVGTFNLLIYVEGDLPADIRVRVQQRSRETQEVLVERAITLTPLNPFSKTDQRPPTYGFMTALRVGIGGYYDVGMDIDGDPGEWNSLHEQARFLYSLQDQVGNFPTSLMHTVYDTQCGKRYPEVPEFYADLFGNVSFAYDEEFLYVSFTIFDDGFVGYSGDDERYFLSDSPQLLLDLDLTGDYADQKDSRDDIQLDFLVGRRELGDVTQVALWRLDTIESRVLEAAQIGVSVTGQSYFVEAALPWESLGIKPAPGLRLGIAAGVSDNDTPGTDVQECMISTAPERDWQNPTTWGTLELEP